MKHELKKDAQGVYQLSINGAGSVCPFTPPFVTQGRVGMEIQRLGCTSQCPHFRIGDAVEDSGDVRIHDVELTCGGCENKFKATEYKTPEPKHPGLVIAQ